MALFAARRRTRQTPGVAVTVTGPTQYGPTPTQYGPTPTQYGFDDGGAVELTATEVTAVTEDPLPDDNVTALVSIS